MTNLAVKDYLDRLAFLERRVGADATYRILEPFAFDPKDTLALQAAAKKIAEFVGLRQEVFIVAVATQREGVGGRIELQHGQPGVFIEVSPDTVQFKAGALATLAHEISHKYLHIHDISSEVDPVSEYENEVLTDLTAVFLGLGKLMLNGCECSNTRQEQVPGGVTTVTATYTCGYLKQSQLAFAYLLVCHMRGVAFDEYEAGLSSEAKHALRDCRASHHAFLAGPVDQAAASEKLLAAISGLQALLAGIDKNLAFLQRVHADAVEAMLQNTHRKLCRLQSWSMNLLNSSEYDPCLRFLNAVRATTELSELHEDQSMAGAYLRDTTRLVDVVNLMECQLNAKPEVFNVVTCRNDGTKLRLPENRSNVTARCPRCQYKFVADTSPPTRRPVAESPWKQLVKRLTWYWRTDL